MGTYIYTTDGNSFYTPTPYEIIKDQLLTEHGRYIEVPGSEGNNYIVNVNNISCIEQELFN